MFFKIHVNGDLTFCDRGDAWTLIEYFFSQKVRRGQVFRGTLYFEIVRIVWNFQQFTNKIDWMNIHLKIGYLFIIFIDI